MPLGLDLNSTLPGWKLEGPHCRGIDVGGAARCATDDLMRKVDRAVYRAKRLERIEA